MSEADLQRIFGNEFVRCFNALQEDEWNNLQGTDQREVIRRMIQQMATGFTTVHRELGTAAMDRTNIRAEMSRGTKWRKNILDEKAIHNLRVLGSNKAEFKLWYERLVNAFEAMLKGSREVFAAISKKIDENNMPEGPDESD